MFGKVMEENCAKIGRNNCYDDVKHRIYHNWLCYKFSVYINKVTIILLLKSFFQAQHSCPSTKSTTNCCHTYTN